MSMSWKGRERPFFFIKILMLTKVPGEKEELFKKEFSKLNKRIQNLLILCDLSTYNQFHKKFENGIDNVNFKSYRNIGAKTDYEIKELARKIMKT
jgi:hypothetical protein